MVEIDKITDFFHVDANGNLTRPKSARRITQISCSRSGCPNRDDPKSPKFKRCGKCKTLYCSKECQKEDWKEHKIPCILMAPENIKILRDISTTPILRDHFAVLVILKFGLHLLDAKSLEAISTKPLELDVYLQHEPVNIQHFLHLLSGSARWQDTPMMGIPQVVDVRSDRQELSSNKEWMKQWTAFRENELAKRPGALTIIAAVRYNQSMGGRTINAGPRADCISAGSQSIISFFKLSPRAFGLAKVGTYPPYPISFDDFKYEWEIKATNVDSHIEFINLEIRSDFQSFKKLRIATKLHDFEKQMIPFVSYPPSSVPIRQPESVEFINFIRKKIKQEHIYRMAAAYYEYDSDAIPKISSEDLRSIRILGTGKGESS